MAAFATGMGKLNSGGMCMAMKPKTIAVAALTVIPAYALIAIYFLFFVNKFSIERERRNYSASFAASEKWIVFSAPLDEETTALAVIDRKTDRRKLVLTKGRFLGDPRFSADGERLLVVRGFEKTYGNELLSCSPETWDCRILAHAEDTIAHPVEIRKDVVLFSGGDRSKDNKHRRFDFYFVQFP